MSDIVDALKAEANRLDRRAYADRCVGPDCALSSLVAATAAAEIERLRDDLDGTVRLSCANTDRALAAEARLAEAVEVMRYCRATYVENDDASALERIIDGINLFLAKLEGRSGE